MTIDVFAPKFRIWDYEKKQMFYFPDIIDITEPETHNYLIDTHGSIFTLTTRSEPILISEKSRTYEISLSISPANAIKMLKLFPIGQKYAYELDIIRISLPPDQHLNFIVTTKPAYFTPELPILVPTPILLLRFIPISTSIRKTKLFMEAAKKAARHSPGSIKLELLGNIFQNPELLEPQDTEDSYYEHKSQSQSENEKNNNKTNDKPYD